MIHSVDVSHSLSFFIGPMNKVAIEAMHELNNMDFPWK